MNLTSQLDFLNYNHNEPKYLITPTPYPRWGNARDQKTDVVVKQQFGLKEINDTIQMQLHEERYNHNFSFILKMQSCDLQVLKVVEGRLTLKTYLEMNEQTESTVQNESQEVSALLLQTYRQAWGKLHDAQNGFTTLAQALKKVNQLKDHLSLVCPQILKLSNSKKLLSILTQRCRPLDLHSEYLRAQFKICEAYGDTTDPKEKQELLEKAMLGDRLLKLWKQECEERRDRVLEICISSLGMRSFTEQKGSREAPPVIFIVEKKQGKIVAVVKKSVDKIWPKLLTKVYRGADLSKLFFLSSFNQTLSSYLNVLLENRFGIPLLVNTSSHTLHAYIDNIGNLYNLTQNGIDSESLKQLDRRASQRFVLAQLITMNANCHGEHILITPSYHPLSIDFSRILSEFNPPCSAFLKFPSLDMDIDPQEVIFYNQLNVEQTMHDLIHALKVSYPLLYEEPLSLASQVFIKQLELLRARLYMVTLGIKKGLNLRQLITLDFPKLPMSWVPEKTAKLNFLNYLRNHAGFNRAWQSACKKNKFNFGLFCIWIEHHMDQIKKMPADQLYTKHEETMYRAMGLDTTFPPILN